MRGRLLRGHQVTLGTNHALQRGNNLFADGIDRRVGHLREHLLEVLERELGDFRHHREGRVVAHGPEGFRPGANHGEEDHVERLAREPGGAEGREEAHDAGRVVADAVDGGRRGRGSLRDESVQLDDLVLHPVGVRTLRGDLRLHVGILQDGSLVKVHEEDVTRSKPPFLFDILGRDVHDADFGRHDDAARLRDVETAGP